MQRLAVRLCALALLLLLQMAPAHGVHAAPLAQEEPTAVDAPLGAGFTFQGRLDKAGQPVSATCAMSFDLWDAAAGGTQVGATQAVASVVVTSGLFTVLLNSGNQFGATAFNGQARFLETGVLCPGDASETALPRQQLTAAPYALTAVNALSAQVAGSANGLQGRPVANTAPVPGQVLSWNGSAWVPVAPAVSAPDWNTLANIPAGFADNVDNEGWSLNGNADATVASRFGTTTPVTVTAIVSNAVVMRFVASAPTIGTAFVPSVLGGFSGNVIGPGVQGSVIGGGGAPTQVNLIFDHSSVIGGGIQNRIGVNDGSFSPNSSFIGGGFSNEVDGSFAVIAGGRQNDNDTSHGVVGGGQLNRAGATASYSTVPGGLSAVTRHYGQFAHDGGQFSNIGDAQVSTYLLRNVTDSITTRSLYVDCNELTNTSLDSGTPCASGEEVTVPSGRAMTFRVTVTALVSSGSGAGGQGAAWSCTIEGLVRNDNGITQQFPGPTCVELGDAAAITALSASVVASDADDVLRVNVLGPATTTVRWLASVETVEVAITSVAAAAGMVEESMEEFDAPLP